MSHVFARSICVRQFSLLWFFLATGWAIQNLAALS